MLGGSAEDAGQMTFLDARAGIPILALRKCSKRAIDFFWILAERRWVRLTSYHPPFIRYSAGPAVLSAGAAGTKKDHENARFPSSWR